MTNRADRFGSTDRPPWLRAVAPAVAVVAAQLVLFPVGLGTWLQGLVIGMLNGLVVLGMMLVYRANRVINLAQASMGTLPAALGIGVFLFGAPSAAVAGWLGIVAGVVVGFAAALLARQNRIRSALIGAVAAVMAAALVTVMGHAGYLGALVIGLVAAVVIGLGVDLAVVRRFRSSPRLVLTVATIGLAQFFAVGSLLMARLWGRPQLVERNKPFRAPGDLQFEIGTTVFRVDEVLAVGVALVCVAVVSLVLARTSVGIAVRAAAERGDRAAMLGVPVARLEAGVWVTASVLAFLGTFLQAGVLSLEITTGVGLRAMVAALAAMALAGFGSLPAAVMTAVAIGILSVASGPAGGNSITTTDIVLAVVVVIGLLVRRAASARSDRSAASSWKLSVDPTPIPGVLASRPGVRIGRWVLAAAVLVGALLLPAVLSPSQDFRAAMVLALSVLALSVVVLTGWTGEVTLGQMGLAAVGAAVTALATVEWEFDLLLALLCGGVAAALVGVLLGLPSLRWPGIFFAVTTLAFGVAVTGWFLNPSEATWIPRGPVFRRPFLGVWDLSDDTAMYRVCLLVLVVCVVAVAGIRRSRPGRVLRAVRDNPVAAQAFGVRVPQARLMAFALSGFLAGVGGGLVVYVSESYDVGSYTADQGINVFIAAVVGGVGSAFGAVLGAIVLDGSRNFLSGAWALLPTSVGVLVVLMFLPGGLAELMYRLRDRLLGLVARRQGLDLVRPDRTVDPGDTTEAEEAPVVRALDGADLADTLSVRNLNVAYDDVQVLFAVDVDIRPGEITALLGTNGAGKSTLLRAIGGVVPVRSGSVRLRGQDLLALDADQVAGVGVAQMPGGAGVFEGLTVAENLRVAAWGIRGDRPRIEAQTAAMADRFPVLADRSSDPAGNLSGGQQQQLALAMAMLSEPDLLLIDELSLGLAPLVVESLLEELRTLRDRGTTILIVEQSVNVALSVADHAYFMEKGSIRFSGSAAELLAQPDLIQAIYLQGTREALAATPVDPAAALDHEAAPGPAVPKRAARAGGAEAPRFALEARGLSVAFGGVAAVRGVELAVAQGEIVGLIGPNGAGKTTLFDVVSGFVAADAGRVRLGGVDVTHLPPSGRSRRGLGRSFQDARLFPGLTVAETIATALERWIEGGDPLSSALRLPPVQLTEAAVAGRVDELMELFSLTHLRHLRTGELSTGSRRMVDLACVVAHGPSVILLDEPTSGIAQREAEALGPVLIGLRDRLEASMVIIEHDISMIAAVSDRLVALDSGALIASGAPAAVLDHPLVVASYLGSSPETRSRSNQPTPAPPSTR